MQYTEALRERLLRRAETVLRPSLAILLECALEGERTEPACEYLERLSRHFFRCAENGEPLGGSDYEVFDMLLSGDGNAASEYAIGLLSRRSLELEEQYKSQLSPADAEFISFVTDRALALRLAELAPIVLGVGVSDSEEESRLLARLALFRSPDKHSPDDTAAECEKRILARINGHGCGAGGFGGSHTALAVSIEHNAGGFITLLPGDSLTRYASMKI